MLRSKEWQTPWLIDSTGQEVKNHLYQMVQRLLSHHLFTRETEEIFLKKRLMRMFKTLLTVTSKDKHGQEVRSNLSQMALRLLSQTLPQFQPSTKDPEETFLRRKSMRVFKISLTRTSKDKPGQDLRKHSFQTVAKLLSQLLHQFQHSIKDPEELSTSLRKTLMPKFTDLPTPTSTECHGLDPISHSLTTDPTGNSQRDKPITKETVEIFLRRRSMLRFKVWQTPWSTDLTGQDPRSHSFQTALKFLASQLPHLSTKETEEIFPRRKSTLKFKVWPTLWSIDLTGQDPKGLSYQTEAKSLSQPLFINIKRDNYKKILPTRKLDQMSGLPFTR